MTTFAKSIWAKISACNRVPPRQIALHLTQVGTIFAVVRFMKHSLQLKLSQHLTLTPQLQQSIRLLQLSTLELNQELERMLKENPLLEREDEDEASLAAAEAPVQTAEAEAHRARNRLSPRARESDPVTALDDSDWNDYSAAGGDDEDSDYAARLGSGATLRDHL